MTVKSFIKKTIKAIMPYGIYSLHNRLSKRKHHGDSYERFYFEINVADHCNLNCVGCGHFSPIADEHFYNITNYRNDIARLAELVSKHIHTIRLMGGEPLLHKDIIEIIGITRKNFDDSAIHIVTNGILLDRMDTEFWSACKLNNIVISISPYPINLNIKKICEMASQHGVIVEHTNKEYITNFQRFPLDVNGLQNRKESFRKCLSNCCHNLYDGKVYKCSLPPLIRYINKYFATNFEVSNDDSIDIYKIKHTTELLKFLKRNDGIPFCRYCNEDNITNVPWGISKKEISEWI